MNPCIIPEPEQEEFTLEDILREFGSGAPASEPESEPEPITEPEPGTVPQTTLVMEPVSVPAQAPATGNTQVFAPVVPEEPDVPDEPEEEPEPAPLPTRPAKAEPFSEDWEPEYDAPMGEFTPKEPIPFPPKSRLRQLRQKLVAGPERRYQALAELGIGQLQAGIMLNFLLALLSIGLAVFCTLSLVPPQQLPTIIFCQLLLAMLAALIGCQRMLDGLSLVLRGRFALDSTLLVTFAICIVDGLLCLHEQRIPCSSLFCLQILFSQTAAYHRRNTELSQMDVLRKASDLTALAKIEDYHGEHAGYVTREGEPEDFLEHYLQFSTPSKTLSMYALIALLLSAGLAIWMGVRAGVSQGIQVFMAAQLMSLPASAFVSMSRPAAIVQNRLHQLGAVLCGWRGIRATEKDAVFPLSHQDLFPEGTIKMNGVKFYGTVDPGLVVSYTTAMIRTEESGLLQVFQHLPRSRDGFNHAVEDFTQHPGGIAGVVDGCSVLVGTAQCMEASGICLPEGSKVPQAIYTAVDGQLSGVFAATYSRSKFSAQGLRSLCGDRSVVPTVIACDFLLTPKFIREKLSVGSRRLVFPDRETRLALSRTQLSPDSTVVALMTRDGLAPKAYALTGARALLGAWRAGAVVHILGGALGLLAVALLALSDSLVLLNPVNLLLYTALWAVPGLLITEHTRYL